MVRRVTGAPRSPDAATFARFLEDYPSGLALWRTGEISLYEILARLNIHAVVEQRALAEREGPHLAAMALLRPHHNQLGICVAWALRYLPGRATETEVRREDLAAAFELAGRYWSLSNVMAEVRQGVRVFESRRRRITIHYRGDAPLDTTDRLLDFVDDIQGMPEQPPPEMEVLRSWLRQGGPLHQWDGVPLEMREELRHFARSIVAQQESYLAPELDVGGFTMDEATRVLIELFARASYSTLSIGRGSVDPQVVLPVLARSRLVGQLALATRVPRDQVEQIVALLVVDLEACPDPCLTPIVPLPGGDVVAMSSLITPGALVRNFTARLQLDHARFGEAGRQLGLLGSQSVAATLRGRLPTAKIGERIKVFHADGRQAGDFDVVAFDPTTAEVVVFEVVWRIGPDGSAEVAELERRAHAKRDQVLDLRAALQRGARPDWPTGWVVPDHANYHWFILTPNVLPTLLLDDRAAPPPRARAAAGSSGRSRSENARPRPRTGLCPVTGRATSWPAPPTPTSPPSWSARLATCSWSKCRARTPRASSTPWPSRSGRCLSSSGPA